MPLALSVLKLSTEVNQSFYLKNKGPLIEICIYLGEAQNLKGGGGNALERTY